MTNENKTITVKTNSVLKVYPLSYKAKDYEMENPYYRLAHASLDKDKYDRYIMRYGKDVYYAWRAE